jgi:tRNA-specific adenosine deaminase 2
MGEALELGRQAVVSDEVPVGCVFVRWSERGLERVAGSHNLTNLHQNASRHCEVNCLYEMEKSMSAAEIASCILIVTVEPCIMCTFALNTAGIKQVYFGQYNDKFGGCGSLRKDNLFAARGGVRESESLEIIKSFYERGNQRLPEEQRNRRKKVKLEGEEP